MAKFDIFVGREKELALIDGWAEKWGTIHLIVIDGVGGIGKTFLLNKVMGKYRGRADFAVVYYDLSEQPPGTLREALHLVESLGWENFPQFRAKITDLASGKYDIADIRLPQLEQDALSTLVKELSDFLSQKRLVRLTDTLDAIAPERPQRGEIYQYVKMIPNLLDISAGREAKQLLSEFKEALGEDNVTYIELKGFNQVESNAFFVEVDKDELIPPDVRAKLHFLTNGRPVLLSLAAEWLSRDVPLPEVAERSLADLAALPETELHDLRERFEFELVDRIRRLKSPLDRAALYMAHINRRSDARILSVLLDLSLPEAQELVQQLSELSFVRYNPTTRSCMLHDEMKNLVNKHAWPYVDPTGDVRRALTHKIIADYYEPRIGELARQVKAQLEPDKGPIRRATVSEAEWEQWRLEAESLYYHLKISEEEGFAYFDRRFEEAQRNNHLMRMQFLLSETEVAGHADIRDKIELRKAETLRLRGELERARAICESTLKKEDSSLDNRISAHITLGLIAASTEPAQAKYHFETALQFAQGKSKARIIGVLHNNLGQIYQLTYNLDQAMQHYQQAIKYSKRAGNQPLMASATNNQAYVYRLQGDLAQADAMCRVALVQRKKLGLERDLAYSYLTKAEIDRDKGDLESAERYTKLALRSFDKVGEARGQIMAYRSLANIHRHLEQYDRAEVYLEQAIDLTREIKDEPLLTSILDVYGREQRDHALYLQEFGNSEDEERVAQFFRSAQEYLEQCLELARRYGDQWLLTRGQLELALTYFLSHARSDEEIAGLLHQVWENASRLKYRLLQGYVEEIRGEIALRHDDYATAAKQFGLAAQLIGQFTGREVARFFDRLSEYLLDIELSSTATETLARGILEVIGEPTTGESLQILRALCQQILALQAM